MENLDWDDILPETHVVRTSDHSPRKMVELAEERIQKDGWDQKPLLCVIIASAMGAEVLSVGLPEEITADMGEMFPRMTNDMIGYFAEEYKNNPDDLPDLFKRLMEEVLGPGLFGVLISAEGWNYPEPDPKTEPELHAQWAVHASSGKFNDTYTGSRVEERNTWLMTLKSDVHWISRARGEEPTYQFISGQNWEDDQWGSMIEATRQFIRVLLTLILIKGYRNNEVMTYWHGEAERYIRSRIAAVQARTQESLSEMSPEKLREILESFRRKPEGDG